MRLVIHIFNKDIRGLRYEAALAVLLTLGMALQQAAPQPGRMGAARVLLPALAVLAWVLLVLRLVQHDAPMGTGHDWRTRPVRGRDLALAKLLFVGLFLCIPMAAGDAIVLLGSGISPLGYLPAMAWKALWLSVTILAPAAALGAITRNLAQALLAALAVAVAVMLGLGLIYTGLDESWGGVEWVRTLCAAFTGLAVSAGVLWLQYRRQRTTVARALAAGGIGAVVLTCGLLPWEWGFGVQRQLARQSIGGVRVEPRLDALAAEPGRPRLPFAVLGVPAGFQAEAIRGRVAIEVDGRRTVRYAAARNGALWLGVPGHGHSPARIEATLWLALLAPRARVQAELRDGAARVEGLGVCEYRFGLSSARRPAAHVLCRTPYRAPAAGAVVFHAASGAEWRGVLGDSGGYSPFPTELWLAPLALLRSTDREMEFAERHEWSRATFETWEPVAFVERSFSVDVKRLGDYAREVAAR